MAETSLELRTRKLKAKDHDLRELTNQINELSMEKEDALNKSHSDLLDKVGREQYKFKIGFFFRSQQSGSKRRD